jgi:hypothetical protein
VLNGVGAVDRPQRLPHKERGTPAADDNLEIETWYSPGPVMEDDQVSCSYREDEGLFIAVDPSLPEIAAGGETEAAARASLQEMRRAIKARPDLPPKIAVGGAVTDALFKIMTDLPAVELDEPVGESREPDSPAR